MRYEVQTWDGKEWRTVKCVNGHTQRNAIERSGITGKVRAVVAERHWNAMPGIVLSQPDYSPKSEPIGAPLCNHVPKPQRTRWSQMDRSRATKPITGKERLKVVMLDKPARIDHRMEKLDYSPDRYRCEVETREGGTTPSRRDSVLAKDLTPKRLGFYR